MDEKTVHGLILVIKFLLVTFYSAYVEQHYQLPNDEWSSDTECEQRSSSPCEQIMHANYMLHVSSMFCSVFIARDDLPQVVNLSLAVKRHGCYLKELYKEREGMRLKWPPVLMKDFVNVLVLRAQMSQMRM